MSTVFLYSCSEDEPEVKDGIEEVFSFMVDGQSITFTVIDGGSDILNQLVAQGREGTNHEMEVLVSKTSTGTFTQEDHNASAAPLEPNYSLRYTDENGNSYGYFNEGTDFFSITITQFGNDEESLISGTFSGTLSGSFLNSSSAPERVKITNGSFTVSRSDATSESIW